MSGVDDGQMVGVVQDAGMVDSDGFPFDMVAGDGVDGIP